MTQRQHVKRGRPPGTIARSVLPTKAGGIKATRMEAERRRRGWTQGVLGKRAGFTQAEISQMENRRLMPPQSERLKKLAKMLRLTVETLFDEAEE